MGAKGFDYEKILMAQASWYTKTWLANTFLYLAPSLQQNERR